MESGPRFPLYPLFSLRRQWIAESFYLLRQDSPRRMVWLCAAAKSTLLACRGVAGHEQHPDFFKFNSAETNARNIYLLAESHWIVTLIFNDEGPVITSKGEKDENRRAFNANIGSNKILPLVVTEAA